ncbi:hypothetical protein LX87_05255 [Larkinella arboricola]|uniref:Uncharacterized protein n=1 Tax=Larkinella arboricola TaxID=643671 RepID=A0A327WPN9_LARAB|nr:hypothetical protein [Larkinella arboricola]RAJ92286.1 hypothetical protein LX87_05255 [Larkinella arboricola]
MKDPELIGSRAWRMDPGLFTNQSGAAIEDGDEDELDKAEEQTDLYDEPVDKDGDPTGEHDHNYDDNYALGGKVARGGSGT